MAAWILAVREGAESGRLYHANDKPSVMSAVQAGAALSQIIGLEPGECTEILGRECDRALEIQNDGLLATLIRMMDYWLH